MVLVNEEDFLWFGSIFHFPPPFQFDQSGRDYSLFSISILRLSWLVKRLIFSRTFLYSQIAVNFQKLTFRLAADTQMGNEPKRYFSDAIENTRGNK